MSERIDLNKDFLKNFTENAITIHSLSIAIKDASHDASVIEILQEKQKLLKDINETAKNDFLDKLKHFN